MFWVAAVGQVLALALKTANTSKIKTQGAHNPMLLK